MKRTHTELDNFGLRLEDFINENFERHRDFAKKLGVRDATVCMWINGSRLPNIRMIQRICKTFNLSADWLLLGVEQNENVKIVN